MTRWIKILLIVSLFGTISCQSYRDKKKLQQDLASFLNSEIVFPPGLIPFQLPDTLQSSDLLNRPYKIVIFIDSAECNGEYVSLLTLFPGYRVPFPGIECENPAEFQL